MGLTVHNHSELQKLVQRRSVPSHGIWGKHQGVLGPSEAKFALCGNEEHLGTFVLDVVVLIIGYYNSTAGLSILQHVSVVVTF